MKPVKLNLKNCPNIGRENAAENTAFVFSLMESCKLNGINPETYLEKLIKALSAKKPMTSGNCCPVISKYRLNLENHFFCVIHITG
jgi:hypothetical protein